MKILTTSEKKALISQHKKERDRRIADRLKAILWYDAGISYEEIANRLFLSKSGVERQIREYRKAGKLTTNNGGSKSKLTESESIELCSHLENHTYTKVKGIINHIQERYGKKYSNSGLTKWLHEHGFTYKKPKGVPAKLNTEAQEEFIEKYRKLEKDLKEGEEILFMDSCHPTQATKFGYGWIKKGKDKQIKTGASRKRVNITGVINIKSREVITEKYETINSEYTIEFLKKVLSNYPKAKTIHIVADGAGYHKSDLVKRFISGTKIKMHIRPPYSPNLNPIERLWKIMSEYVRNNKYFKSHREFVDAIDNFFSITIPRIPEILQSRINSNFQIIQNSS